MEQRAPYDQVSEPYSVEHYNGINLTLRAAIKVFEDRGAQEWINTTIRQCFLRHHVEDIYSACLIHRHFDIAATQRNVEHGGRAFASDDLDRAWPSSWMVRHGKLYPYEYKRSPTPCPPKAFVEDFARVVMEHGVEDIVGFQTYQNGVVGLESTDYDALVSTTVDQPESDPVLEGMAPASWAFFRLPDEVVSH